jgi:hypothetical protein
MAYDEDEKEYLKLVIHESINTSIKPIMDQIAANTLCIQRLDDTTFGVNGNNGLNGDMKSVKKNLEGINIRLAWIAGAAASIGAIASTFIKKIIEH